MVVILFILFILLFLFYSSSLSLLSIFVFTIFITFASLLNILLNKIYTTLDILVIVVNKYAKNKNYTIKKRYFKLLIFFFLFKLQLYTILAIKQYLQITIIVLYLVDKRSINLHITQN